MTTVAEALEVDTTDLKDLVQRHRVCFESYPIWHVPPGGGKIAIGYPPRRLGAPRTLDPRRSHARVEMERRDCRRARDPPEPAARTGARALRELAEVHPMNHDATPELNLGTHRQTGTLPDSFKGGKMTTHTDPVCGMKVGDQTTALQSNYQGKPYHFCGQGCKTKFDQNPQQYASKTAAT